MREGSASLNAIHLWLQRIAIPESVNCELLLCTQLYFLFTYLDILASH